MKYSTLIRRSDGTEIGHVVSTTEGDGYARTMADTLAESYGKGSEVTSIIDADGRDLMADQKDPLERESQQPDDQNKTATERVDKQTIETKEVRPDKTTDVKPNR